MMLRLVILPLTLLLAMVAGSPMKTRSTHLKLVTMYELEEGCVRQGGLCTRIEDCVSGSLVQIDGVLLCPNQRHLGIECCYT